jgi:hypothetical protein
MRIFVFTVLAMLAVGHIAWAAAIPHEVSAHIEDMKALCRQSGGMPAVPKKGFLISGHLTDSGFMDWAIDEDRFVCVGAWSIFGGSGGSQIYVFVGQPGNEAEKAFNHGAFGFRIRRGRGRDTLWVNVGGPLCGQAGNPSHAESALCERPIVWDPALKHFDFAPLSTIHMFSRPRP